MQETTHKRKIGNREENGEMCSQMASAHFLSFNRALLHSSSSHTFLKPFNLHLHFPSHVNLSDHRNHISFSTAKTRATMEENDHTTTSPLLLQQQQQQQPNQEVEESVKVLKNAAKTRRVAVEEVLSALSVMEKAKIDPSGFLGTLGGSESPGRTWMLIFTSEKQLKGGRYFPLTAIQRFDATAKRIENGVYLGPVGCLTFEGRFSWKNRILSFIFERIKIKVGPLNPLEISLGQKEDREPSTKDPFFIWFYIDDEIAVARGKSGGTAFWCRCQRVS